VKSRRRLLQAKDSSLRLSLSLTDLAITFPSLFHLQKDVVSRETLFEMSFPILPGPVTPTTGVHVMRIPCRASRLTNFHLSPSDNHEAPPLMSNPTTRLDPLLAILCTPHSPDQPKSLCLSLSQSTLTDLARSDAATCQSQ
jgi:hypothetical protein